MTGFLRGMIAAVIAMWLVMVGASLQRASDLSGSARWITTHRR